MVRQNRNLDQLTEARMLMMTRNMNRDPKTPVVDDISLFLPHPVEWRKHTASKASVELSSFTIKQIKRYIPQLGLRQKVALLPLKHLLD